jgi:hypothetical protein
MDYLWYMYMQIAYRLDWFRLYIYIYSICIQYTYNIPPGNLTFCYGKPPWLYTVNHRTRAMGHGKVSARGMDYPNISLASSSACNRFSQTYSTYPLDIQRIFVYIYNIITLYSIYIYCTYIYIYMYCTYIYNVHIYIYSVCIYICIFYR